MRLRRIEHKRFVDVDLRELGRLLEAVVVLEKIDEREGFLIERGSGNRSPDPAGKKSVSGADPENSVGARRIEESVRDGRLVAVERAVDESFQARAIWT